MTPQYIDVPSEACRATIAASARVHGWLRSELRRKLEPVEQGKRTNRLFNPHAGLVPALPKPRATCKVVLPDGSLCGRKAQAKELCCTHYERKRDGRPMNPPPGPNLHRADVSTEALLEMRQQGLSYSEIGRRVGMRHSSVIERLKPAEK